MAKQDDDEIRIRGTSALKKELKVISKNVGIPLSALLKPKIRELIDSYPAAMKVSRDA